jgi:hypothetical protein
MSCDRFHFLQTIHLLFRSWRGNACNGEEPMALTLCPNQFHFTKQRVSTKKNPKQKIKIAFSAWVKFWFLTILEIQFRLFFSKIFLTPLGLRVAMKIHYTLLGATTQYSSHILSVFFSRESLDMRNGGSRSLEMKWRAWVQQKERKETRAVARLNMLSCAILFRGSPFLICLPFSSEPFFATKQLRWEYYCRDDYKLAAWSLFSRWHHIKWNIAWNFSWNGESFYVWEDTDTAVGGVIRHRAEKSGPS